MNNDQTVGEWQASIGNAESQPRYVAALTPDFPTKAGAPVAANTGTDTVEWGKKAILLVDSNLRSRESRAKVMRTKGVRVDCVANADAARVRLAAERYNLVLVDLGHDIEAAQSLVDEIRASNSRQLVKFLVGSPLFVAASLSGSNSRPRRASAPVVAAPAEKPSTPVARGIDFGQKIRDAEAEHTLNETRGSEGAAGR